MRAVGKTTYLRINHFYTSSDIFAWNNNEIFLIGNGYNKQQLENMSPGKNDKRFPIYHIFWKIWKVLKRALPTFSDIYAFETITRSLTVLVLRQRSSGEIHCQSTYSNNSQVINARYAMFYLQNNPELSLLRSGFHP